MNQGLCITSRALCSAKRSSTASNAIKSRLNTLNRHQINVSSRCFQTSSSRRIDMRNIRTILSNGLVALQEFLKPNDGYPPWRPTEQSIKDSVIAVPAHGATTLTRDQLIDKIKGTIFGQALGDAMGLATEFMTRSEAAKQYSSVVSSMGYIPFDNYLKDDHRTWWEEGDWTDDTDQMITILDSIISNSGNINELDIAQRLRYWTFNGFTELGDTSGTGLGVTVISVVGNPDFTKSPHEVAQKVYEKSKGRAAANGGVMRTSILGIPNFHDISKVKEQTTRIFTSCIAQMLQGKKIPAEILQEAGSIAKDYLNSATNYTDPNHKKLHIAEFEQYCSAQNLEALQLDQGTAIGYTFKAMGAALVLLKSNQSFKDALTSLTMEGGDADSNGAVAGAVLGCHLGFSALPQDLINQLPHKEWLETKVDFLLQLMRI